MLWSFSFSFLLGSSFPDHDLSNLGLKSTWNKVYDILFCTLGILSTNRETETEVNWKSV